jgi:FliI/YscN family ATPase
LVHLAPFEHPAGIYAGAAVRDRQRRAELRIPRNCLGLVFDALGRCLSLPPGAGESGDSTADVILPLLTPPPSPLGRRPIAEPLATGIRTIDGFLTIGHGQRLGLFAPAGAGKSTLLGMIARNAVADATVIALVGERGREVNDFIHNILGPAGLKRCVLVVSTSDEAPVKRRLAPYTATAIAEYFRSQGLRVLLLVDSLTRTARAIREVGLSTGELPVSRGYTPSVYSELPQLIERTGNDEQGSITAIYTVLTEACQELDPLAEEVKSLLDGHIVLDNAIAQSGVRPAIDVVASVSRLAPALGSARCRSQAARLCQALGRLKKDKDILLFGGTPDRELKAALALEPELRKFLSQGASENVDLRQTQAQMTKLSAVYEAALSG